MGVATTYKRPGKRLAMHTSSADHSTVRPPPKWWNIRNPVATSAVFLAALLVAGCPSRPPPAPVAKPGVVATDPIGELVARAGRETDPAHRAATYLDALLQARSTDPAQAEELLARLLPPVTDRRPPLAAALPEHRRFELHAVALQMALARQDVREAQRLLSLLAPANERQSFTAAWLRARVFGSLGAHRAAATTLMDLLTTGRPPDPEGAAAEIWRRVSRMSSYDLDLLAGSASRLAVREWAAVGRDLNAALTANARAEVWRAWLGRNPRHAAARFPPVDLGNRGGPRLVAVLTPMTGELAEFGEAIRDGVLTAYLHSRPPEQRLLFFDTRSLGAREAYERAVAAGAEAIVGPLDKAAVATLARLAPRVPVAALNTPDPAPVAMPANLVQLTLAVEDEAAAVAKALAAAGAARVVLFHNDSSWATRARERLRRETRIRIVVASRLQALRDIPDVAATALAIEESAERHAELETLLSVQLAFTPRRRADIDAVVAFVEEEELLALKPALDFHFAADLPVYVWSRMPRGALAGRLDGVRVCDIPWRLHPSVLRDKAVAAFSPNRADSPLFALGVDGYRVVNQFPRLTTHGESIAGATGVLTLTPSGRLRRELAWAEAIGNRLLPLPSP